MTEEEYKERIKLSAIADQEAYDNLKEMLSTIINTPMELESLPDPLFDMLHVEPKEDDWLPNEFNNKSLLITQHINFNLIGDSINTMYHELSLNVEHDKYFNKT